LAGLAVGGTMLAPLSSALKATDAAKAENGKARLIASATVTSSARRHLLRVDIAGERGDISRFRSLIA
jgi:hypothetical protein